MRLWKYVFIVLFLILALIVISISQLPDKNLHVIACDVGEGDAILIIYKNFQVLVDGGPDNKVLNCLGKHLPFYDRRLELVVLTHPDGDHFGGLVDVFKRYKVESFLANPITVSKQEYKVLEKMVGSGSIKKIYPHEGQVIRVGMIYLDTLAPPQRLTDNYQQITTQIEVSDTVTNDYSIVSLVSFGKFRALLTGDLPPAISEDLAAKLALGTVDYIKVPHHGSANGMTENLVKAIVPKIAVISVGVKNLWGFPSPKTLEMLEKYGVKILRTDQMGDVEIVSDGEKFWRKN